MKDLTPPDPSANADAQQTAILGLVKTLKSEMDKRFDERDVELAERVSKMIEDAVPACLKQYAKENPDFHLPGAGEAPGEEFSIARAIRAIASRNADLAPYEFECFREMNKMYGDTVRTRAMNTDNADESQGHYLVPEQHANEIIDLMYADSVAFGLGARAMPNQFGDLKIPVLTSGVSAAWLAENTAATSADLVLHEHTMRPKQLMAATTLSNVLLTNSRPTAEGIIRDHFVQQFRVAIDAAILKGSGSGAEPTGIVTATPGSGENAAGAVDLTTSSSSSGWTYANAMEFITDVAAADALRGSLAWAMDPTEWSNAVQMASGTTNVDVNRLVISEGPQRFLLGYPVGLTTQLVHSGATGGEETVIFGDWSQIRVPFWKTLELRASDVAEDTFLKNQTMVRGVLYTDVSIDHLESFSIGSTDEVAG